MTDCEIFRRRSSWSFWVRCLFFAGVLLYVMGPADTTLFYHAFGTIFPFPDFAADGGFLREHLHRPGGLTDSLAAGLSQCFYDRYLGGGVLWLASLVLYAGVRRFVDWPRRGLCLAAMLPVVAVVAAWGAFSHPLRQTVGLCLATWLSWGLVRLAPQRGLWRRLRHVAGMMVIYWLTGSLVWCAAAVVLAHEVLVSRRYLCGLIAAAAGAAVPFAAGWILDFPAAHRLLLPFVSPADQWGDPQVAWAVILSVPAAVCGALVWRRIVSIGAVCRWGRRRLAGGPMKIASASVATVVLLGGTAVVTWQCHSLQKRNMARVVMFSRQGRWNDVRSIAYATPLDGYNVHISHAADRALAAQGRLGEEMFRHPQHPVALMLPGVRASNRYRFWQKFHMYLAMGDVNAAQWQGWELLATGGNCPDVLEGMALIYASKNQPAAARVMAEALRRDVIHGRRGDALLADVNAGTLRERPEVRRLAGRRLENDLVIMEDDPRGLERLLRALVGRDPANRMALEYLMAHYLLTRHLEHFVTAWQTVDERALAGVDTVPVHWAEAIVIYEHRTRRKVDLRGRTIDPEVRRRTQAFIHIAEAPRWRNRQQAEDALADSYGRTYGYFLVFGISGVPGGGR